MKPHLLIALPVVAALLSLVFGRVVRRERLLTAAGFATTVLSLLEVAYPTGGSSLRGYVHLDPTGRLFLAVVNPIFFGVSAYVWGRVTAVPALTALLPRFVPCALVFLAATNGVFVTGHLLVAWIALEATTLCIAPLIINRGSDASGLASWHYLLFSTVGLALAFLGILCVTRGLHVGDGADLYFFDLLAGAARREPTRLAQLGVALLVLGIGTKLGLAPMYSWLPEAYDEAPPAVAALLGGVQFNAALLLLFRVITVFRPMHGAMLTTMLVWMGAVSMLVATMGIVATRNIKRLVAYASINHAGMIAIGLGLGRSAAFGVMLYIVSNAFIKTILFLTVGRIKAHCRTKDATKIGGLLKGLPYSGTIFMVGCFALLGLPPFGSFFGELLVLSALVRAGHLMVFAGVCALLTIGFVATGRTVFPMIWGDATETAEAVQQRLPLALPHIAFLIALVVLGLYIPAPVNALLNSAASAVGGS